MIVPTGLARPGGTAVLRLTGSRLVGSGEMGTDIVTHAAMMDGIDVAAIADIDPARAHEAVTITPPDIATMPRRAMTSTPPSKAGAPL